MTILINQAINMPSTVRILTVEKAALVPDDLLALRSFDPQ
jgi:hypothetical protein